MNKVTFCVVSLIIFGIFVPLLNAETDMNGAERAKKIMMERIEDAKKARFLPPPPKYQNPKVSPIFVDLEDAYRSAEENVRNKFNAGETIYDNEGNRIRKQEDALEYYAGEAASRFANKHGFKITDENKITLEILLKQEATGDTVDRINGQCGQCEKIYGFGNRLYSDVPIYAAKSMAESMSEKEEVQFVDVLTGSLPIVTQLSPVPFDPETLSRIVKVKDGLISVYVPNEDEVARKLLGKAKLVDVIKKIEAETGIRILISNDIGEKRLNAYFENNTMEEAMKWLLMGHYYVIHYEQDPENREEAIAKEVKANGLEIGSKPIKGEAISIEIPYGSGKGEVGAFNGSEGSSMGPSSYRVDAAGNIYICDTVNERIQTYSPEGTYLYTLSFKDEKSRAYTHSLTNVEVDSLGFIYILDHQQKLYQYNNKGNLITAIRLDDMPNSSAPMSIIGSDIYIPNHSEEGYDVLIGKILSDGTLIKPSPSEVKMNRKGFKDGLLGSSGRRYRFRGNFNKDQVLNREIDVIEKDGRKSMLVSFPPRKDIVPAGVLEDEVGNSYSLYSKDKDDFQLYFIDMFNADKEYIGTAQMPVGHHYYQAGGGFILKNGKIYNLIAEKEKLIIYVLIIGK